MSKAIRVVAHLSSRLAGDPPFLDSMLIYLASRMAGKHTVPGHKVDRQYPCPDTSKIAIPILRTKIAGWQVARATAPIMDAKKSDGVEHFHKRISTENARLLAEDERIIVNTTGGPTKSYRLPLRIRLVPRIAWLCIGTRREIAKMLDHIPSVGKKTSFGYGRVSRWEVTEIGEIDSQSRWPWWIDSESGPVLMRPLPVCPEIPAGLIGARKTVGACVDPYWHPERFTEIVVPAG